MFSREKKVESRPNGMDASAVGPLKRANCAPALLCAALAHVPPRRASPASKGFRIKAPIAPAEEDRPLLESSGWEPLEMETHFPRSGGLHSSSVWAKSPFLGKQQHCRLN